jgi:hypothetical protein
VLAGGGERDMIMIAYNHRGLTADGAPAPGGAVGVALYDAFSRGELRLTAADPEAQPAVDENMLADPRDRDRTRCDVVTLHQGGLYHLYRYRTYADVRLVFAPERQIAAFGGDADNFEFPRYCLDVCLFRAYEDGRPARVPHHLAWARAPAAEGEIVFVSGHPGHTDRGDTVAELVALETARASHETRARELAPNVAPVRVGREELTYRADAGHSFLRDAYSAEVRGDFAARQRIERRMGIAHA